jgi:photosystem II stability/assembly factor-like uncharacterized protein
MKKLKIIAKSVLLIPLLTINILCQSWITQKTNTKAAIMSICFLDSLNGWAVTDSITYLHTTDGGDNWRLEQVLGEKYGLQRIQFITKEIGYACASQGRLFSTTDGGKTWTRYAGAFEIDFQDLFFVNEYYGWAVGQRYGDNRGRGMIVHTSDGGKNWEKQYEHESTNQFATKFFKAIRMKNKNTGWAIAGDYFDNFSPTFVYKTDDGGKNWNLMTVPIKRPAKRLKIANNDTLWVDGYGVSPMSSTVDGGISWNLYYNEYKFIGAISPRSGNRGWCSYINYSRGSTSYIIYTTDRGNSWKKELEQSVNIIDIENKGNYLWIAGSKGLIMKKNLLITSVNENTNDITDSFELYQNYPNPFNPQTTISYHLPFESDVRIKIYDVLGSIVSEYFLLHKSKGKNEFQWNAKSYYGKTISTGVYFYQVTAKTNTGAIYQKTSKMLLMK